MPTKPQVIRQGNLQVFHVVLDIRSVVQIALWVGGLIVDSWGDGVGLQGFYYGNAFKPSCCTKRMTSATLEGREIERIILRNRTI